MILLKRRKKEYTVPSTDIVKLGEDLLQTNMVESSPVVTPWQEDDGGEIDFNEAKRMNEIFHEEDSLLIYITRDKDFKFK